MNIGLIGHTESMYMDIFIDLINHIDQNMINMYIVYQAVSSSLNSNMS